MPKAKSKKVSKSKKLNTEDAFGVQTVNRTTRGDSKKTELKKEISNRTKISNVLIIFKKSWLNININLKAFSIVTAIYFALELLLVRGFASTVNVVQLKNTYINGKITPIGSDISVFGSLIGTGLTNTSAASSIYQTSLFVLFTLIFIWMLRTVQKTKQISIRDSFYKSQTPLIPIILILLLLGLELIPMLIGLYIYITVFTNNIAVYEIERIIWFIISFILISISVYLIVSTIFAIYIVTLPDVKPVQAIKSSWRLVKKRRFLILRKVLFLPISLFVVITILSILFIAVIPAIADFIFYALGMIAVLISHSYLYNLYKEMI